MLENQLYFSEESDLTFLGEVPTDSFTPPGCTAYKVKVQTSHEHELDSTLIVSREVHDKRADDTVVLEKEGALRLERFERVRPADNVLGFVIQRRMISAAGRRAQKARESVYEKRGIVTFD